MEHYHSDILHAYILNIYLFKHPHSLLSALYILFQLSNHSPVSSIPAPPPPDCLPFARTGRGCSRACLCARPPRGCTGSALSVLVQPMLLHLIVESVTYVDGDLSLEHAVEKKCGSCETCLVGRLKREFILYYNIATVTQVHVGRHVIDRTWVRF